MSTTATILYTLGGIAILEGMLITIMPKKTKKIVTKALKTIKGTRSLGLIESIVGLILIIIAAYL